MARIKDLVNSLTAAEVGALVNTIFLAVDDPTFSAAHKTILGDLIVQSGADLRSEDDKAYLLTSAKALFELLPSETLVGLMRWATTAEIVAGSADAALRSADMADIRNYVQKSIMHGNGSTSYYWASDDVFVDNSAMQTRFNYRRGTMNAGTVKACTPSCPTGIGYGAARTDLVVQTNLGRYSGVINQNYPGDASSILTPLGSTGIGVYYAANGLYIGLQAIVGLTSLAASVEVKAICQSM